MKRRRLPPLACLFALGCSGSQPGPGADDDGLRNETRFCARWAEAACNDEVVDACNGTREGCLETQESACRVLVPPGYDSENARECLEAVEDAYDDAELTAEELEVVLKLGGDCARLVDGGRGEGDACTSSFDCNGVDGFECVVKPGDPEGTCQIPVEVGGGRNCADAAAVCEADFYCDGRNCIERLEPDDACSSDICAVGLHCEIASGATEGTCVAGIRNGDPCTADHECASRVCLGPTATEKICVSSVVLTVREPLCTTLR